MARPKGTTRPGIKYLSQAELGQFFDAVRKTKNQARRLRDDLAYGLMAFFGLRVSELAGLRLADIDTEGKQIRIKALKNGLTMTQEISPGLDRKLSAWLKKREKGGPWLFPGRVDGQPISVDRWKAGFKGYARLAGLSSTLSVHSLRHSVAVMMAEEGASPIKIARWLRQRRTSSAEKYFAAAEFKETGRQMAGAFKGILG